MDCISLKITLQNDAGPSSRAQSASADTCLDQRSEAVRRPVGTVLSGDISSHCANEIDAMASLTALRWSLSQIFVPPSVEQASKELGIVSALPALPVHAESAKRSGIATLHDRITVPYRFGEKSLYCTYNLQRHGSTELAKRPGDKIPTGQQDRRGGKATGTSCSDAASSPQTL